MNEIDYKEEEKNYLNFKKKYNTCNLHIFQRDNWLISLRPCQCTYGALLLYLNRPCKYMQNLKKKKKKSLGEIFSDFEKHALINLKASKINIIQLMLVDEHIHFHLFPRYENESNRDVENELDKFWPNPIDNYNFECISITSKKLLKDSEKLCQI